MSKLTRLLYSSRVIGSPFTSPKDRGPSAMASNTCVSASTHNKPNEIISNQRIGAVLLLIFSIIPIGNLPQNLNRRCTVCLVNRPEQRSEEHTSELQSRGHLVCR